MARTTPGLVVVLVAMFCSAPAVDAAPCKGKKACKTQAKAKAKAKKPKKNVIDGVYNGGPGDPILGPLPG